MFYFLIKPFSPHLTIYKIQNSSLFSILHRVSALLLLLIFLLFSFFSILNFNFHFYKLLFLKKIFYFFLKFFTLLSFKLGIFHFLNGIKIVLWNFSYFQISSNLNVYNQLIIFFFLIVLIFI
uniref:Succinate dehydrogenase subunit 3 n=1 Tax=Dictyomenia sonderi TaxID=2007178 RepID=UPI0022FD8E38|nr:Succinate dehydrogenase subunit 3 [Dictyomenia sonderi]WAX04257.1 Succinate dehydrogenase subunit 3 [Dictyomenia sonderi]